MQYITVTEAASRLGVTEKTVRRWIKSGKLSVQQQEKKLTVSLLEVEGIAYERQQFIPGYATTASIPGNLLDLAQQIQELRAEIRSVPGVGLLALGPGDMTYIEERLDKLEARLNRIERVLQSMKTQ
jgi:predicted transcriptional regulator